LISFTEDTYNLLYSSLKLKLYNLFKCDKKLWRS